jgi:hypothetical protein
MEALKAQRIPTTEVRGFCHDCHNTARVEVTFSHRAPIRLCDRCATILIIDVGEVAIARVPKTGKYKH